MKATVNGDMVEIELGLEEHGVLIVSLDEAEAIGEQILDCCQKIVNAQPDPPVVRITWKQFNNKDYPENTNIDILEPDGFTVASTMRYHFKRFIR